MTEKPKPGKLTPEQYNEPRAFSEAELIRLCGSRAEYEEGARHIARVLGHDEEEVVRRLYWRPKPKT